MMKYTIPDFLEETARAYPNKVAFADLNTSITWEELVVSSKRLSAVFSDFFEPNKPIPIMCDKSVRTLQYFFAAVYAGCFYTFIDETLPPTRLQSMMETLETRYLVVEEKNRQKVSGLPVTPIFIEELQKAAEHSDYSPGRRDGIIDTDPLYANFTSGSTGIPKAVLVSHRSVIDFISCFTEIFDITAKENIANQAPFDFDVSVKDIFSAVFTGATVHLVPKQYFSFPVKLLDFLEEREITVLIWAVSALCIISTLNGFSYKTPRTLRKIMFSGEVMPTKHLRIWQENIPAAEYVNLYGPTEITCNCTYHKIEAEIPPDGLIPMGKPFPNERVFLLDENNALVTEPEVVGEVCVSGTCVAIGYYNNKAKTEEVFLQNPLNSTRYERIYRTGDLARYDKEMTMYYVSRKDTQIKHMGHRIELGEIEAAIDKIDTISRTCCIFYRNKIHAFYTGTPVEKKQIVNTLKATLPVYMIPSEFYCLENFPLTKNGKVDRRALEGSCNA